MAIINGTTGDDTLTGFSSDDVMNGLAGNDAIYGYAGNDTIFGNDGNDLLNGLDGADTMSGGAGNDSYFIDNANDIILADISGIDSVTVQYTTVGYTLAADIENLSLYGGATITGNGNNLNNTIYGNWADNYLYGALGNDILFGFGGGNDTAVFHINQSSVTAIHHLKFGGAIVTSSEGVDTLVGIANLSFLDGTVTANANGDAIKNIISSLALPTYTIKLSNGGTTTISPTRYNGPSTFLDYEYLGDASSNIVEIASSGSDFINLLGGDDAANGGDGDDVLDGGTGSNFLTGGNGTNTFFLDGRSGTATWSTITDFAPKINYNFGWQPPANYSEQLNQLPDELDIWGWQTGTSRLLLSQEDSGAEGFTGATLHFDLDGNASIDTSVTFTGLTLAQVPASQALSVAGNGYLLIG